MPVVVDAINGIIQAFFGAFKRMEKENLKFQSYKDSNEYDEPICSVHCDVYLEDWRVMNLADVLRECDKKVKQHDKSVD